MSDLHAWLTKHADCDYGWFVHDGGFLRCHAHDDDLAAVVFTVDSLAAALDSHDATMTQAHPHFCDGRCAAAIIQAAKEVERG